MKSILFSTVLQIALCIETIVLETLTLADQQALILAHELFNIIESQRFINQQPLTCLTLIPTNLTKSFQQKIYPTETTFPNSKGHTQKQIVVGTYEDYDYDKILDLLHGTCVIHQTNQFLYEYCHKQHVRQFDDIFTYQNMVKESFEDINMGYFGNASNKDRSTKKFNQDLQLKISDETSASNLASWISSMGLTNQDMQSLKKKIQLSVSAIPTPSVIEDKNNSFKVSDIRHKQYQLNKQDKLIHLNYPIIEKNQSFRDYFYEVTCQEGQQSLYTSSAVALSFFDMVFLGNISQCNKVINISQRSKIAKSVTKDLKISNIRHVEDFLYSEDLESICSNNWNWNMNQPNDFLKSRINYLSPGNTLWLELEANVSSKLKYKTEIVTVKKTIAPNVIKAQENIQNLVKTFKTEIGFSNKNGDKFWINTCRIISQIPLQKQSLNSQSKILRQNIIKIKQNENINKKKPGDQMICVCGFEKQLNHFLDIHLTLGFHISEANPKNQFYSYFSFYRKKSVKTTSEHQSFSQLCEFFLCYDVNAQKKLNKEVLPLQKPNQLNSFTKIFKLTISQPAITQGLQTDNQILILDLISNSIIKIWTEDNGSKFYYLLLPSKMLKFKVLPDGKKQIVAQNPYYQNSTSLSGFSSNIFIHKNYVWRGNDKVILPRLDMGKQKITRIERVTGSCYLRILEISKMKQKNSHYISDIEEILRSHFRVKKYPIFQTKQPQSGSEQQQLQKNQNAKQQIEINTPVDQILNQEDSLSSPSQNSHQSQQDYSQFDFTKSEFKPLNKSVKISYQYSHGDFCGSPINRQRKTTVELQCGQHWLKIQNVKQISPCIYQLKVVTKLLCSSNHSSTIQDSAQLNKNLDTRIKLQRGVVCYPLDAWDNTLYVYDVAQKAALLSVKQIKNLY